MNNTDRFGKQIYSLPEDARARKSSTPKRTPQRRGTTADTLLDREFAAIRLAEHIDPQVLDYLAKRGVPAEDCHVTSTQLKRLHDHAIVGRGARLAAFLAHCNLWARLLVEESDDALRAARPCHGKLRARRHFGVPRIIAPDTYLHAMPLFKPLVLAQPGEEIRWYRNIDVREWVPLRCTPPEPDNGITRPIPVETLRNHEFAAYSA